MVAIVGYSSRPQSFLPGGPEFTPALSTMEQRDNVAPFPAHAAGAGDWASVTDTQPVSELALSVDGFHAPGFLADYYYRIHVIPGIIDLGNLLSAQTRTIEVWSSHFESKLLASVLESNTEGLTLQQPQSAPTYFSGLESRTYVLTIDTSGPPVVDAKYLFDFPDENPTLSVAGRRVVVMPERPKYPLKESLQWKTDIIRSFAGEQRIRLRDAPRQILSIESVISNQSYTKLKAVGYQWAHRVFAIPVWTDAILVPSIAAGSSIIYLNTVYSDFRSFDILVIWNSETDFEAIETLNVYADRIELKLPTSKSYTNAFVIPARFANTLRGLSFSRDGDAVIRMSSDFTVRSNKNLESISSFSTYKSLPVILDKPLSSDKLTDLYIRDVDIMDNGSSSVYLDIKTSSVDVTSKMTFMTFNKQKAWEYRQFIHYLHGQQKTFFIPSWHDEFEIIKDFSNTSTSVTIKNVGFTLYYDNRFLYIESTTGSRAFCRVLSSSITNDGDELLNLESTLGFSATVNQIKICCLLKYVRLNSDTVSIKHDVADEFSFDLQTVEVPYEL
mgnify:CR=1 FL=1